MGGKNSGRKALDHAGKRFGMIVVIERVGVSDGHATWRCDCDCGGSVVLSNNHFRRKDDHSCGCAPRLGQPPRQIDHHAYASWAAAKSRCGNPRDQAFAYYGGRGIRMCAEWLGSFDAFLRDMGERPFGTSIDRKDNDGDYEPGNCRWATAKEQARNTRKNVFVEIDGVRRCVSDWASVVGIKSSVIHFRIRSGWDPVLAVTTPAVPRQVITWRGRSVTDWAIKLSVSRSTVVRRLSRGNGADGSASEHFPRLPLFRIRIPHETLDSRCASGVRTAIDSAGAS